jgi:hypothetical protein
LKEDSSLLRSFKPTLFRFSPSVSNDRRSRTGKDIVLRARTARQSELVSGCAQSFASATTPSSYSWHANMIIYPPTAISDMSMGAPPAHFAHILASSPFNEGKPCDPTSSPIDSPASDVPRYFNEREYDDRKYSYSSPPSSVPSSGNSSYSHASFHPYPEYCQDVSYGGYSSSPLAQPGQHYQLPPPPPMHHMHQQQGYQLQQGIQMHGGALLPPHPEQAPRAAMIPGLAVERPAPEIHPDLLDRPEPKRRKTCPEIFTIESSPTKSMKNKRGAGKDGEDVWPTEVEVAFFECKRR